MVRLRRRQANRLYLARGRQLGRRARVRRRAAARRVLNTRTGGYMGQELKFGDTQTVTDAFALTWAVMTDNTMLCVSAIARGTSESERIGRKYWIEGISIRGVIQEPAIESATNPISDTICRICLVLDTQTNGAVASPSQIMDEGQTDDTLAFRNLQHTARFKVLWDKWFTIPIENTNEGEINKFAAHKEIRHFTIFKKFRTPIPVECKGDTAVVASISTNTLTVIGIGNKTSTTLDYQCRIRFRG